MSSYNVTTPEGWASAGELHSLTGTHSPSPKPSLIGAHAVTTDRRSTYADRAAHFDALAVTARTAGDTDQAAHLEAMAHRAHQAHEDRAWRHAEGLIYDHDECCIECGEHISDSHGPGCVYADAAYATT